MRMKIRKATKTPTDEIVEGDILNLSDARRRLVPRRHDRGRGR